MNKKIIFSLIIIVVVVSLIYYFKFKSQDNCPGGYTKDGECVLESPPNRFLVPEVN